MGWHVIFSVLLAKAEVLTWRSLNPNILSNLRPRSGPILEAFFATCARRGEDLAVLSRGEARSTSFVGLAEQVEQWAEGLQAMLAVSSSAGPRPVALAVGNRGAFIELFFALRRLGRAVVIVDAAASADCRLEICRRFGVGDLIETAAEQAGEALGQGLWLRRLTVVAPVELPPATALVKLTSGSTGEPVGACFDEAALRAGIEQIAAAMELQAGDRALITIPLSHSYGFDNAVLSLAVVGTSLLLEPSFFPHALLRAARDSEATFLPLVPPLVRSLAQADWPAGLRLRRVICAGAPLDEEVAAAFYRVSGLAVHNFYGSSETGGICFERQPLDPAAPGTVGEPLPGVQVELDDGRVTVLSAANSIGTPGRPGRAPAAAIVTGDTGVWDEGGRLRLTGRSADILNIGGRKVAIARIEQALLQLAGVHQAAVVGVADRSRGDLSMAFLVADRWPIDTRGLAAGLVPRRLSRIDQLPYNSRGKLDRALLRRRAAANVAADSPSTAASPMKTPADKS